MDLPVLPDASASPISPLTSAKLVVWTVAEETRLVELRARGDAWDAIAAQLTGRSPAACQIHWRRIQDRHGSNPRPALQRPWTEAETKKLFQLKNRGKSWEAITRRMPGRTIATCKHQYFGERRKAYRDTEESEDDVPLLQLRGNPGDKTENERIAFFSNGIVWSKKEEESLLDLWGKNTDWEQIIRALPGRSRNACVARLRVLKTRSDNTETQGPLDKQQLASTPSKRDVPKQNSVKPLQTQAPVSVTPKGLAQSELHIVRDLIKQGLKFDQIAARFPGRPYIIQSIRTTAGHMWKNDEIAFPISATQSNLAAPDSSILSASAIDRNVPQSVSSLIPTTTVQTPAGDVSPAPASTTPVTIKNEYGSDVTAVLTPIVTKPDTPMSRSRDSFHESSLPPTLYASHHVPYNLSPSHGTGPDVKVSQPAPSLAKKRTIIVLSDSEDSEDERLQARQKRRRELEKQIRRFDKEGERLAEEGRIRELELSLNARLSKRNAEL